MSHEPPQPADQPQQPYNHPQHPQGTPTQQPGQPPYPPYGAYQPYRPPPGQAKPSWLSHPGNQKKAILVAAAILVVGVIVAIVTHNSGGSGGGSAHVSGSRDDWLQAVCKDGTYRTPTIDMPVFRGASGSGLCLGRNGGTILVGQWDSEYMMRNAFAGGRLRYYAAASDGDLVTGFASLQLIEQALEPLTQFGFTINELPPRQ